MIRILVTLVALAVAGPLYAEDTKPVERRDFDKKTPLDNDFLAMASECLNCQCSLADLVEKRASRQEVKEFAKRMEEDHKALLKDLAATLKDRKVAIVAGTSKKDKERCKEVGKLEGTEFEKTFLKYVADDHEKAIRVCENQIKNGKDQKVTEFATSAVKKLREHLKEAKRLQS